ncbi:unnamed protein product [Aspergillus oryzae]|uniref:Unnamed protein product n=2 Tax=Aspergillus oryzae TaxID=5062 RepID=A0AAN4Z0S8_ASPOZ|nr:unnamed protein product [Aspergillus oryzae]
MENIITASRITARTKDLTTDSASDRSTLVRNTGMNTQLCTLFGKFPESIIRIAVNTDDIFLYVAEASIPEPPTRLSSPIDNCPMALQHVRLSGDTIFFLPDSDLSETPYWTCSLIMTCFNGIFLKAITPPWLGWFCFGQRSPIDWMDCDNGRQDDSKSATSHDKPLSGSSEYQTPRPLFYEEDQPNPPALVKSPKYSLFPKQSNPSSSPKIQRIKPASHAGSEEEAKAARTETLRKDHASTDRIKGTSTSMDSGEIIVLPEP